VNKQHMELAEATERPKLDPFKYADSFDCSGLHCALSRSVAARNRSIAPSVGYGWGKAHGGIHITAKRLRSLTARPKMYT
jgi:hypothetical protein